MRARLHIVDERVRALNGRPFRNQAKYVLYRAQMNRRTEYRVD